MVTINLAARHTLGICSSLGIAGSYGKVGHWAMDMGAGWGMEAGSTRDRSSRRVRWLGYGSAGADRAQERIALSKAQGSRGGLAGLRRGAHVYE